MTNVFRNKSVLITGATGFIGRNLIKRLLEQGAAVYALVRSVARARKIWHEEEVRLLEGDLTRTPAWCDNVAIDTVFHLAGMAHDHSGSESASETLHRSITVEGTKNLLKLVGGIAAKRIVFASSVKAMGEDTGSDCLDESSPNRPGSAYGRAKLEAEGLVLSAGKRYGMHVCNLRLSMVIGPDSKGNLPRMIKAIDKGRFPPLPDIKNRRSLVHVEDVVEALLLAAEKSEASGETLIVSDGNTYSTREIYTSICQALGKRIPGWSIPVGALTALAKLGDVIGRLRGKRFILNSDTLVKLTGSACYRSDKIVHLLGFQPSRNLQNSLPEIIAEYRGD
ncbi:MAG: NAD-dependent epimerase/dehydratase family protein [Gammaproteobacteria bacterium]|nr:NAD-dependent epimerase/dehydratase family protein [Gammaproteobacteria bacterium]